MMRLGIGVLLACLFASHAQASCGPDSIPAVPASVGWTCETFYDHFQSLSTIDTTNSGAPGFKWYIDTTWVNNAQSNWGTYCATHVAQCTYDSSNYSITTASACGTGSDNTVLGLCMNNSDNTNVGKLGTCGPASTPNGDGFYINGQTFVPPLYIEMTTTFVDPGRGTASQWPELFSQPAEFLAPYGGSRPPPPYATVLGLELDPLDNAYPIGGQGAYQNSWSGGTDTQFFNYVANSVTSASTPTTFALAIVPGVYNTGTPGQGVIVVYKNGTATLGFNYGHSQVPGNQPTAPVGAYSQDWQHQCFMTNTGFTAPMHVTSIQIWQKPPATGGSAP